MYTMIYNCEEYFITLTELLFALRKISFKWFTLNIQLNIIGNRIEL